MTFGWINCSVWVLMNKETRRLTKLSNEVRVEMGCRLVDLPPAVDEDNIKIPKLDESIADYIRSDLIPRWSDLDQNQHVNNAKYIDLILESVPISILASHELSNITVEYKRECGRDNVLKSLTHVLNGGEGGGLVNFDCIVCEHLLQIVGGADIVKARSKWKLKFVDSFGNLGQ
ncbi:Thiolester hydrolase [Sarracenia purpurea var. burkii]